MPPAESLRGRLSSLISDRLTARHWAALIIAAAAVIAFLPALQGEFINYDDDLLLTRNPDFRGLGLTQLRWMFTTTLGGHFHPLTWMSFAVDHAVWGMDPFGYHLTNVLLHGANTALFFFMCVALIKRAAPDADARGAMAVTMGAAFAALLFGMNPLRVQSVAWAVERKDVLSAFFYLATLLFYLKGRRALSLAAYALSLLSKGAGISLPLALLILDIYPLRRLPGDPRAWFSRDARPVLLEKAPYALLGAAAGAGGILLFAPVRESAMVLAQYGPIERLTHYLFSLSFHLWKTIVPLGLLPQYQLPHPSDPYPWQVLLGALSVVGITALLIIKRREWPAGLAAWIYYAATLTPMIVVLQLVDQLAADHHTYLACLGFALLAGAGLTLALRSTVGARRRAAVGAAAALILILGSLTYGRARVWRDSESLWRSSLAIQPDLVVAHVNLGNILAQQGRLKEANAHFREALKIKPLHARAHLNLGCGLADSGDTKRAEAHYRRALEISPDLPDAHHRLARILIATGRTKEAKAHYALLLASPVRRRLQVMDATALSAKRSRGAAAVKRLREGIKADPGDFERHYALASALAAQGDRAEALPRE
ncbi:tetratricopeptide repeat protein, partial [Elusimicrobiota bacterium]